MKNLLTSVFVMVAFLNSFAAGDYFPIKQGNAWLFTYNKSFHSWGSSTTESGTIRWDMTSVVYYITYPAQVEATVIETRSLCRRTYSHMGWPGDMGYDSIFIPFRVTKDTILFKGLDPGNGLTVNADTCWSFVHDPKGTIPTGMLIVRDTTVSCLGRSLSASIIDPSPCASQLADQSYFITAADLGPVEYHLTNSPNIVDAFWNEDWSLVWTNLNPVVGGPCAYSKYIGTAVITRVQRPDTLTNEYSVFFRFSTKNTVQEAWALSSINQEKDISAIAGIEDNLALYHIKPGNSYVCTLDVINAGTCSPLIYHLKTPSALDNIDTSSMWIAPDSVAENKAFQLNLLSYYFTCGTQFLGKAVFQDTSGIALFYKPLELQTAGICAPSAKLYGTGFTVPALTTGRYPVFSAREPDCYPICRIMIPLELVDTLTVTKALSITIPGRQKNNGGTVPRLFNSKGQTVFEGFITRPGKITVSFYNPAGALLGSYSSAALSAGWHRIEVPDASVAGVASAKGPIVVRMVLPDGKELRKVLVRM